MVSGLGIWGGDVPERRSTFSEMESFARTASTSMSAIVAVGGGVLLLGGGVVLREGKGVKGERKPQRQHTIIAYVKREEKRGTPALIPIPPPIHRPPPTCQVTGSS